jgi:hypothetical protein
MCVCGNPNCWSCRDAAYAIGVCHGVAIGYVLGRVDGFRLGYTRGYRDGYAESQQLPIPQLPCGCRGRCSGHCETAIVNKIAKDLNKGQASMKREWFGT